MIFELKKQVDDLKQQVIDLETERDEWRDKAHAVYYEFEKLTESIRDNHWIRACPPDLRLVKDSQVKT